MYAFKDPFPYTYIILSHLVLLLEYSAEVSEVSPYCVTPTSGAWDIKMFLTPSLPPPHTHTHTHTHTHKHTHTQLAELKLAENKNKKSKYQLLLLLSIIFADCVSFVPTNQFFFLTCTTHTTRAFRPNTVYRDYI